MSAITRNLILVTVVIVFWHGYGVWQYRAGYRAAEGDKERAELKAFRESVNTIHATSERIYNATTQLQSTIPVLIQGYNHETSLAPLAGDCGTISAGRLLIINAAIEQAASTCQSGRAVP